MAGVEKSDAAFRTISEVADHLRTPAHVLRFWESRFPQIRPVKRAGGRRYYRPADVALLAGIRRLLHDDGLTIRGVQKILREQGVRHVSGLSGETVDGAEADWIEAVREVPRSGRMSDEDVFEAEAEAGARVAEGAGPGRSTAAGGRVIPHPGAARASARARGAGGPGGDAWRGGEGALPPRADDDLPLHEAGDPEGGAVPDGSGRDGGNRPSVGEADAARGSEAQGEGMSGAGTEAGSVRGGGYGDGLSSVRGPQDGGFEDEAFPGESDETRHLSDPAHENVAGLGLGREGIGQHATDEGLTVARTPEAQAGGAASASVDVMESDADGSVVPDASESGTDARRPDERGTAATGRVTERFPDPSDNALERSGSGGTAFDEARRVESASDAASPDLRRFDLRDADPRDADPQVGDPRKFRPARAPTRRDADTRKTGLRAPDRRVLDERLSDRPAPDQADGAGAGAEPNAPEQFATDWIAPDLRALRRADVGPLQGRLAALARDLASLRDRVADDPRLPSR